MSSNPYHSLAKEFMDLWQKQVATVVNEKKFIEGMMEMFQTFQHAPSSSPFSASEAAYTAHASDVKPGVLAELTFRLAMCEKRIAALEQQLKQAPNKPKNGKRTAAGHGKSTVRRSKPKNT